MRTFPDMIISLKARRSISAGLCQELIEAFTRAHGEWKGKLESGDPENPPRTHMVEFILRGLTDLDYISNRVISHYETSEKASLWLKYVPPCHRPAICLLSLTVSNRVGDIHHRMWFFLKDISWNSYETEMRREGKKAKEAYKKAENSARELPAADPIRLSLAYS